MTERCATASRWYAIALAASALVSACSLLAPSDDELMGGHSSDAGSKGGAGTGGIGGNGGGTTGGKGGTSTGGTSTGGTSTGGTSTGGTSTGGTSTGGTSTGGTSTGGTSTGGTSTGGTSTGGTSTGGTSTGGVAGGTGGTSTGGTGGSGTGGTTGAGSVSCSGSTCDLTSSYCCYRFVNGTTQCQPNGQSCLGGYVRCDGPEDCPGEICCAQPATYLGNQIYSDVRCRGACDPPRIVFCGADPSVCPPSTTCQPSSIAPEYNVCQ